MENLSNLKFWFSRAVTLFDASIPSIIVEKVSYCVLRALTVGERIESVSATRRLCQCRGIDPPLSSDVPIVPDMLKNKLTWHYCKWDLFVRFNCSSTRELRFLLRSITEIGVGYIVSYACLIWVILTLTYVEDALMKTEMRWGDEVNYLTTDVNMQAIFTITR